MTRTVDAVVIGSGHNGLVAAAYLARAGWQVEVLERNGRAGGAVATAELTDAGVLHDTFSSWHTPFHLSATFRELGPELQDHGLRYCNTSSATTATVLRDGRAVIAYRDPGETSEGLEPVDRQAYLDALSEFDAAGPVVGRLLGSELHSMSAAALGLQLMRRLGRRGALRLVSGLLSSGRGWSAARFAGRAFTDLYGPWALHAGVPPDVVGSGAQMIMMADGMHRVGKPVVVGGSTHFVRAFESLLASHGAKVRTGVDVEKIVVRGGEAKGVLAAGEQLLARRAVIANVTPTQLYGRLVSPGDAPAHLRVDASRYRYSRRAGMQIHVALNEPLRWRDARLAGVPVVHLADGLDAVAASSAQGASGLLPADPTVVVGRPDVLDPSRVPDGRGVLWIQLQDMPFAPTGDAAGLLDVGAGRWAPALVEGYVERVLAKVAVHVANWETARGTHAALSPEDLASSNINFVQGDIYSGDCELGQSLLWRPLPGYGSHRSPIGRLWQCGAATWPGPGLNAASGRIVARRLLAPARRRSLGNRIHRRPDASASRTS